MSTASARRGLQASSAASSTHRPRGAAPGDGLGTRRAVAGVWRAVRRRPSPVARLRLPGANRNVWNWRRSRSIRQSRAQATGWRSPAGAATSTCGSSRPAPGRSACCPRRQRTSIRSCRRTLPRRRSSRRAQVGAPDLGGDARRNERHGYHAGQRQRAGESEMVARMPAGSRSTLRRRMAIGIFTSSMRQAASRAGLRRTLPSNTSRAGRGTGNGSTSARREAAGARSGECPQSVLATPSK